MFTHSQFFEDLVTKLNYGFSSTDDALVLQAELRESEEDLKASSWLEQIRGREDSSPPSASAGGQQSPGKQDEQKLAAVEQMNKLMALQSLQNSLHLITMGMQQNRNPLERLRDLQQQQQVRVG